MGLIFNGNGDVIKAVDGSLTVEGLDLGGSTNIEAGIGTFSGNLTVGGVLTYEDVKNVDSVGIVTARTGIHIDDSITHIGDTNTKIRFPAADTITAETGGSERLRIASDGDIHVGGTARPTPTVSGFVVENNGKDVRWSQGGGTSGTDMAGLAIFGGGSSTNVMATASWGGNIALHNTNNTDGNSSCLSFCASTQLATSFVVGETTSHSSRNGELVFATSSGAAPTERVRITSAGHLGVGDNNPDTRLSVTAASGTDVVAKFTSTDANAWIQFRDNSTTDTGVMIGASGDHMMLRAGSNERLRIDSSGRMGLGTNAPDGYDNEAENFVVASSDHTGITIASTGSNKRNNLYFADGTSGNAAYRGAITYDHASDYMMMRTAGAERFRITSDGKVGINKTNPSVELEVRGTGTNGQIYLGGTGAHSQIYADNDGALILSADQGNSASNSYAAIYVDNSERARFKDNGNCGFGENNPQAAVDAKGSGVPMVVNSTNSNTFKIQFKDNGTVRSAIGANSSNLLDVADSSGNSKFAVTTPGVAYNGSSGTHGSGVYMCEVHTDLLKLLKSSQNHPNTTGNYYSWSDGGTASWSWDNGVLRMDSNVGSHTWQCGSVYLTAGYYTLMQCWRACSDAHGWSNFGSSSNGNQYSLTTDAAYGSYNTLLTSYSGQHSRSDGKSRWFSTTTGNLWYNVTSAGTYRIQQMGQPYGSGGYKYYILAAYLLKLK